MPSRQPRSPEPRGSHTFFGPISSDRLAPKSLSVPDPLTLATITATTALIASGTLDVTGATTVTTLVASVSVTAANIFANGSSADLGTSGVPFDKMWIKTITLDTLTSRGGSRISVNHDIMPITADLGGPDAADRWVEAHITALSVGSIKGHASGSFSVGSNITVTANDLLLATFDDPWNFGFFNTLKVHTTLLMTGTGTSIDVGEGVLEGIRVRTTNPLIANLAIGEIVFADFGSGATTGRIFIKVNATEIYVFQSVAIIT